MLWAAWLMACKLEPQLRLTVARTLQPETGNEGGHAGHVVACSFSCLTQPQ